MGERLKGITRYSYWPYLMQKAVFHSLPSWMQTKLYAPHRSSLLKIFAVPACTRSLLISGKEYLFLMIILFKAQ